MNKASNKIAIVTGASGGIGRCEKQRLEEAGYKVYNFSRRNCEGGTNFVSVDVTDVEAVNGAVKNVFDIEGRIDLLVNNAGFGIAGAIETTPDELAKRQMEVNFWGTVNCSKAVLPYMRKQGGGRIINTSSVAAVFAIPYQAFYSCSKSAINAFTSALRAEVKPFNVSVCAIMPGDIKTGFTQNRIKTEENSVYENQSHSIAVMEKDEINGMSPDKVAKLVKKLALKRRVSPLQTVGGKYKAFVFLSRFLSRRFCDDVVGAMYK